VGVVGATRARDASLAGAVAAVGVIALAEVDIIDAETLVASDDSIQSRVGFDSRSTKKVHATPRDVERRARAR
jgi:hypothetical protein